MLTVNRLCLSLSLPVPDAIVDLREDTTCLNVMDTTPPNDLHRKSSERAGRFTRKLKRKLIVGSFKKNQMSSLLSFEQ